MICDIYRTVPDMITRLHNSIYLVSVGVSADDDRFDPGGDESGDVLTDDGLSEHRAAQDVTDRAVRRPPHLL